MNIWFGPFIYSISILFHKVNHGWLAGFSISVKHFLAITATDLDDMAENCKMNYNYYYNYHVNGHNIIFLKLKDRSFLLSEGCGFKLSLAENDTHVILQ